jgi:hypothetical protein
MAAQSAGVNVALHGHQHKPKASIYQNLPLNADQASRPVIVISNGSSGASRLPPGERNTYCVFRLQNDSAEMWIRELRVDGAPGAELFAGVLETDAHIPD